MASALIAAGVGNLLLWAYALIEMTMDRGAATLACLLIGCLFMYFGHCDLRSTLNGKNRKGA